MGIIEIAWLIVKVILAVGLICTACVVAFWCLRLLWIAIQIPFRLLSWVGKKIVIADERVKQWTT